MLQSTVQGDSLTSTLRPCTPQWWDHCGQLCFAALRSRSLSLSSKCPGLPGQVLTSVFCKSQADDQLEAWVSLGQDQLKRPD